MDTHSDESEDGSEAADTTCNSCNKDLDIFHLDTCPVCVRTDFYPNCTRCHCTIYNFRLSERDLTHVIASCPHSHCDEIMNVSADKGHFNGQKISEQMVFGQSTV